MAAQSDEMKAAIGCTLIEVGGEKARARWAKARRRHHAWGSRARPGYAQGTRDALRGALHQLIVCAKPGCGALVQLQFARRQARKAGRSCIACGNGCASRQCTNSHAQPGHFARMQSEMATGLISGTHILVLPPPTIAARSDLWAVPNALSASIAHGVRARARQPSRRSQRTAHPHMSP